MKNYTYVLILIIITCSSCKKIYNPDINADKGALVVQGMITDNVSSYQIRLTMAMPYDSSGNKKYVSNAKVSILDDCGDKFDLSESESGIYNSNPAELIGKPGISYTLHIETQNGDIYESSPQIMLPNNFEDTMYAEYATIQTLVQDSYGQSRIVTTQGVNLLTDIENNSDSLPRFRYTTAIITEYTYTTTFYLQFIMYHFCWDMSNPDDLANLTDEKYKTSSNEIQKHTISFIPTNYIYHVLYNGVQVDGSISNRIVKINQYRINQETYQYYKNINSLLSAQSKIFDPIASQFNGNMTCKTNPQKLVLGFFEVSSAKVKIIYIKPGDNNVQTVQSFNPPTSSGCIAIVVSKETPGAPNPPDFWIY